MTIWGDYRVKKVDMGGKMDDMVSKRSKTASRLSNDKSFRSFQKMQEL